MKIFSLLLFSLFSFSVRAQQTITLNDVAKHAGDSVTVTGKVFTARYFESGKGAPTLLNMGAAYPNQMLTVVIYGEDRNRFKEVPENYFAGKVITVSGKVEMYKDKPQIVVHDPSALKISEAQN